MDWTTLMKSALLATLLFGTNALSIIAGSVVWAIAGSSLRVPYLGRLVDWGLRRTKLMVLFKLFAWCVGASGLFGGYLIYQGIFGPPGTSVEWWVIVCASVYSVLAVADKFISFDIYDVRLSLQIFEQNSIIFPRETFSLIDAENLLRILRQNFLDMNIPFLLKMFGSTGMLLYALSGLQIVETNSGKFPTLFECLTVALSFGSIVPSDIAFVGNIWLLIRFFAGSMLLIWTVAFVTVAVNSIPTPVETEKIMKSMIDDYSLQIKSDLESIVADVAEQDKDVVQPDTAPSISNKEKLNRGTRTRTRKNVTEKSSKKRVSKKENDRSD